MPYTQCLNYLNTCETFQFWNTCNIHYDISKRSLYVILTISLKITSCKTYLESPFLFEIVSQQLFTTYSESICEAKIELPLVNKKNYHHGNVYSLEIWSLSLSPRLTFAKFYFYNVLSVLINICVNIIKLIIKTIKLQMKW